MGDRAVWGPMMIQINPTRRLRGIMSVDNIPIFIQPGDSPIRTIIASHQWVRESSVASSTSGKPGGSVWWTWMAAAVLAAAPGILPAAGLPVIAARTSDIETEQVLDGIVEAVNRSTVSAQVSARVVQLPFDIDDFVGQGEVIVRFRDTEQRARVESARANLEEARAQVARAQSDYDRVVGLREKDLVSSSRMDEARAAFQSARAREQSLQAALDEALETLQNTVVRAPYSGIVTERHVEIGETAVVGQPLMTGLSLEHLRVAVEVPQQHVTALRRHQDARVILPDGGSLRAEGVRIFPYASEQTHTFRVRVSLPEGRYGIYPGMLVKVAFVSGRSQRLLIPAEAVVRRSEVTAVYVQDEDGRVQFRQIRAGTAQADGQVPVLAGLDAGETVATDPVAAAEALKEGRSPAK